MPRITFYISEEDKKQWYEKFKEQIGESASSFHVESVKKYVIAKERELKEMVDVILPVGKQHIDGETANIKHVKFTGKMIAQYLWRKDDDSIIKYEVYLTRKGKLLVHKEDDSAQEVIELSYKVHDTQSDFFKCNYPSGLVNEVINALPDVEYEELDV